MASKTIKVPCLEGIAPNGTQLSVGRVPGEEVLGVQIRRKATLSKRGRALQFSSSRKLPDGRTQTQFKLSKGTAVLLRDAINEVLRKQF